MMNPENYPAINVLNVFRGFERRDLVYPVTPYRFMLPGGKQYIVEEIRQFHREASGKGFHFHFTVKCRDQHFYRLLFDTQSLTWRLIEGEPESKSF